MDKGLAPVGLTLRHVYLQTWLRALEGVQFYQLFAILVPMSWLWRRTWTTLTQRVGWQSSSAGNAFENATTTPGGVASLLGQSWDWLN